MTYYSYQQYRLNLSWSLLLHDCAVSVTFVRLYVVLLSSISLHEAAFPELISHGFRAATIKLIANYFDNQLINRFLRKKVKILWFQLLKCEYFLVSFLLCDSKLIIFGVVNKTRHLRTSSWALGNTDQHFFYHFLSFNRPNN